MIHDSKTPMCKLRKNQKIAEFLIFRSTMVEWLTILLHIQDAWVQILAQKLAISSPQSLQVNAGIVP
jgi:hypothetical protein